MHAVLLGLFDRVVQLAYVFGNLLGGIREFLGFFGLSGFDRLLDRFRLFSQLGEFLFDCLLLLGQLGRILRVRRLGLVGQFLLFASNLFELVLVHPLLGNAFVLLNQLIDLAASGVE